MTRKTDAQESFPHSMEFFYLSLADVMTGPESFDWTKTGSPSGSDRGPRSPRHLSGLCGVSRKTDRTTEISHVGGGWTVQRYSDPSSDAESRRRLTPDYEHPALRDALVRFVTEFGKKYDGDPRIGYLTAGLLGAWGEWHTYPRGRSLGVSGDANRRPRRLSSRLYQDAYAPALSGGSDKR